jgi:hypothetical protein
VPLGIAVGLVSYFALIQYLGGFSHYLSSKEEALTSGGQGYLGLGILVIPVLFMVTLTRVLTTGRGRFICFGIVLPLALLIGFFSGSKGAFLEPFLMLLVALHYLRKRVRMRYFLIFGVFVIAVFPFFNSYRQLHDVSQLPDTLQSSTRFDMESLVRGTMSRFYGIDALTYSVRDTPGVMDFQLGRTVLPVTFVLVPRQVWPDKPTVSFGKVFAETYFVEFFHGTGIAAAPTSLGEGYINFHLPGMLFVALWCGFVLRTMYEYFIQMNRGAPTVTAYGTLFLYLFVFWEMDLIGLLVYSTGALALALLAVALIGERPEAVLSRPGSAPMLAPAKA